MQTLPQFITEALSEPREHAFAERLGRPDWTYLSTSAMLSRARAIAAAIRDAGLERGDRVALLSENRLDWIACAYGIQLAGCIAVPMFASLAVDQLDYIFADSGARLAFCEGPGDRDRIAAACPHLPRTVVFDGTAEQGETLAVFEHGGARAAPAVVAEFTGGVTAGDLAVLIYTSGTTGHPKGVMLSHENLVATARSVFDYAFSKVIRPGDPVLSVLPFAHIFEHTALLGFQYLEARMFLTQPEYLVNDLKAVRPVTLALVPRIYERIVAAMLGNAKAGGPLKARLVPWALGVARERAAARAAGGAGPLLAARALLADRLVFAKLKETLGLDRIRALVSGSAPLHRDIALTFAGLGVSVLEGYGLTETPVVSVNTLTATKVGSVGRPIPAARVRLAQDGEIELAGVSVMKGYFNLPAEHPFTEDGWFKTGDVGMLDRDGYLFITDRKKELIKTSTGKYVAPSRVESALRRSVYVGQAFVIGDGRPFPVALVVPNWELIRREFTIGAAVATEAIAGREDVRALLEREVTQYTADLASFEQVRRVALLPRDLTIEDGELSPTLKIKRRVVEKKFATAIDGAYGAGAAVTVTANRTPLRRG